MVDQARALADYLGAVRAAADLMKQPAAKGSFKPDRAWHWEDVAESPADQALEKWSWGLTRFGRPVVVRAAGAMLAEMLPVWKAAAKVPPQGMDTKSHPG
jgi:hypothetical protein